MGPILTTVPFEPEEVYYMDEATIWLVEDDSYYPSTNLKIKNKLDPGIYQISFDRNKGTHCKKLSINSDSLYNFSDSSMNALVKEISHFWEKGTLYKEHQLVHKRGVLLEGPPGNGNTSLISLLSKQIIDKGGIVFTIEDTQKLAIYIDFITVDFRSIQPDTPVVTILEDLEQYSESPYVLDFFDGKWSLNNHVIIATTNNSSLLPDALLRPSRIDLRVLLDNPSENTIREYFKFKGVSEGDVEELTKLCIGLSLADLKEVYLAVYLLDYSKEQAVEKLRKALPKKNYSRPNSPFVKGL